MERVYLDHAATTPVDPRVAADMQPYLGADFGNPSSLHWEGRQARAAVDGARDQLAGLLRASPDEIVFTASGTEADNMALSGTIAALGPGRHHLIVSAIEHPAVLETARVLAAHTVTLTILPPNRLGIVDPAALRAALRPNTRLVSIMAANNVVGTLQPLAELATAAHEGGALFHTDAVQAVGKIPLEMSRLPIDLLSLSAHKFHGPKGIGALFIRKGVAIAPILRGGGQERGLRSATENVAAIVGLGRAAELAGQCMADDAARLVGLRDRLIETTLATIANATLLGHRTQRLPGHVCLGFAGQEGEAIKLLLALDQAGFAVSGGSACSAHHAAEPSYVLAAMGFNPVSARGSLRISLGRFTRADQIDRFLAVLGAAVATLRPITSLRQITA